MKKYYTIAIREFDQWGAQFGDYDKDVVIQEIENCFSDYPKADRKIICTADSQAAIETAIAKLNGKV